MRGRIERFRCGFWPALFLCLWLSSLRVSTVRSAELELGGHVKLKSGLFSQKEGAVQSLVKSGPGAEFSSELRLNCRVFLSRDISFEAHYRVYWLASESMRRDAELSARYPFVPLYPGSSGREIGEGGRFLDLSRTVREDESTVVYHELDRLNLNLTRPGWSIAVGRQAVSWGHGFLFNPFDVFSPFPPTEIDREYKPGEDMINLWFDASHGVGLGFFFVPGRDDGRDFSLDDSSMGMLLTFPLGTLDASWVAMKRFDDLVLGGGFVTYVGNAAVRGDFTWTYADRPAERRDFFSAVLNADYSWSMIGRNWYAFLEYYYGGIGGDDYLRVAARPEVVERLARGEIFTLGKNYLSGSLRVELHPLYNQSVTVVSNLDDPSAVAQLYGVWDAAEDFQVTFGANIYLGGRGTEFGGVVAPGTGLYFRPRDSVFLWLSRYF